MRVSTDLRACHCSVHFPRPRRAGNNSRMWRLRPLFFGPRRLASTGPGFLGPTRGARLGLELFYLLFGQVTKLSRFDVEFQRAVTNTPDLLDVMSNLLKHTAYLPVPP